MSVRLEDSAWKPSLEEKIAFLKSRGIGDERIRQMLCLSEEKDRKWLKSVISETKGKLWDMKCNLSDEKQQRLAIELLHDRLDEKLKSIARSSHLRIDNIYVYETTSFDKLDESAAWESQTRQLGRMCAPICLQFISRSSRCGITLGRMLASMVDGIKEQLDQSTNGRRPGKVKDKIRTTFVPLWGDSVLPFSNPDDSEWRQTDILASRLAAVLHQYCNRSASPPLSLHGIPVFRPLATSKLQISKNDFATVFRFHSKLTQYLEIFGSEKYEFFAQAAAVKTKPMALELDCLFMSVGSASHSGKLWLPRFFEMAGIDMSLLLKEACGDLGGVWLPKPDKNETPYLAEISAAWTGIDETIILKCANSARDTGKPGNVVLAAGHHRALPVIEAAKRGWINRLIIDTECANAILNEPALNQ